MDSNRRFYWQDLVWLAALGLLVQAFWAARLPEPAYLDSYYYTTNGARLATGQGFTEMVIWQYLDMPAGLPTPSHTYWMPLASLLAAVGYKFSFEFGAAQLPFVALTGLLPLLAYVISWQLSQERWQAVIAGLLTMTGGYYAWAWNQPETFAPFAWAGGLCLWLLGQERKTAVSWLLTGFMAGLAHLTRADGVLLLGIGYWILGMGYWRKPYATQYLISNIFYLSFGYLLIMGGWFWRNWLVMGRPLSTTGTQTIFLTTYNDLFAYGRSFHLSDLLAWGWGNILNSRLEGLSIAGQTFVAVCGFTFLTPFVLWAWVKWQKRPLLHPFTWYTVVLFAVMSLVFTFPGGRGGLYHSSVALWPWCMALAPAGIALAVEWMAARLPHWQPERAKRLFAVLFTGVAFLLSFVISFSRTAEPNPEGQIYEQLAQQMPETAVVMLGNAPGFYYHTGLAAISIPNEPMDVLLEVAATYNAYYLILDSDYPQALKNLYEGGEYANITLVQQIGEYQLYELAQEGP